MTSLELILIMLCLVSWCALKYFGGFHGILTRKEQLKKSKLGAKFYFLPLNGVCACGCQRKLASPQTRRGGAQERGIYRRKASKEQTFLVSSPPPPKVGWYF